MRTDVHAILNRSKAFHALPEEQRRALAHDLVRVVAFLQDPTLEEQVRDQEQVRRLIGEVDFPSFVAELIKGVFEAIVQSSIEQMKAYAEMVQAVAKSLDDFTKDAEDKARDHLTGRHQQLATMVLMGINRIVVTDGKIKGKVHSDLKSRDSDDEDEDDRERAPLSPDSQ